MTDMPIYWKAFRSSVFRYTVQYVRTVFLRYIGALFLPSLLYTKVSNTVFDAVSTLLIYEKLTVDEKSNEKIVTNDNYYAVFH